MHVCEKVFEPKSELNELPHHVLGDLRLPVFQKVIKHFHLMLDPKQERNKNREFSLDV